MGRLTVLPSSGVHKYVIPQISHAEAPNQTQTAFTPALFGVKRAQGKPASSPDTRPGPSAHPNPAHLQPARAGVFPTQTTP